MAWTGSRYVSSSCTIQASINEAHSVTVGNRVIPTQQHKSALVSASLQRARYLVYIANPVLLDHPEHPELSSPRFKATKTTIPPNVLARAISSPIDRPSDTTECQRACQWPPRLLNSTHVWCTYDRSTARLSAVPSIYATLPGRDLIPPLCPMGPHGLRTSEQSTDPGHVKI